MFISDNNTKKSAPKPIPIRMYW